MSAWVDSRNASKSQIHIESDLSCVVLQCALPFAKMNGSQLAKELGKLGKDKPKTLSALERERRRIVGRERLLAWHRKQGHLIKSN